MPWIYQNLNIAKTIIDKILAVVYFTRKMLTFLTRVLKVCIVLLKQKYVHMSWYYFSWNNIKVQDLLPKNPKQGALCKYFWVYTLFFLYFLYENVRMKNAQNLRTYPRLRKGEVLFYSVFICIISFLLFRLAAN